MKEVAVHNELLKVRERICDCPWCVPPLCNFFGCVVRVDLWARAVGVSPP